jgi:hypothetical protein
MRTRRLAPLADVTLVCAQGGDFASRYGEVLTKATLYSNLVAVVTPYSVYETPLSSGSKDLEEVAGLNKRFGRLVREGNCVFLPQVLSPDLEDGEIGSDDRPGWISDKQYIPPLLDAFDRWLPLNAAESVARSSDYFVFKHIFLPYFEGLDLNTVGKISSQETDAFTRFNHYLRSKLKQLLEAEDQQTIDDIFDDIENEVARISLEARKLKKSPFMRSAEIASFSITLAGSTLASQPVVQGVAAALGSVTLLEMLKERRRLHDARLDLAQEPFYFPYLLRQAATRARQG